jgi:DNA (cytosine-5)-methyltransferase 1
MVISIATDCSGIEAPIEALKQLRIPFDHEWSCEIDKYARMSIEANYNPKCVYNDITKRDVKILPHVDIYVCGFPCQSFSLMGKKHGIDDPRGNIMFHCVDVIKNTLPNIFILENVKNFKFMNNGSIFNTLIKSLSSGDHYNIYHDIYNTKDYGIPQNRERVFIIGIKKSIQTTPFIKPDKIPMEPLDNYILDKTIREVNSKNKSLQNNLMKINNEKGNVILSVNYYYPLIGITPTLTTQCWNTFHTTYNRPLSPIECLLLQGFTKNFKQVVSNRQLYKQAGNSMSVNVLKAIFTQLFKCTDLNYNIS